MTDPNEIGPRRRLDSFPSALGKCLLLGIDLAQRSVGMLHERRTVVEGSPPPLILWGGVFAGTVIGLATGGLVSLLWLGLAYGSHRHLFYQHLDWWLGATAIFAMLLAGVVAGASSAARGVIAGIANGVRRVRASSVLGVAAFGIPASISTATPSWYASEPSPFVRTLAGGQASGHC